MQMKSVLGNKCREGEHLLNLKYNNYFQIYLNQEMKYFKATKLLKTNQRF